MILGSSKYAEKTSLSLQVKCIRVKSKFILDLMVIMSDNLHNLTLMKNKLKK